MLEVFSKFPASPPVFSLANCCGGGDSCFAGQQDENLFWHFQGKVCGFTQRHNQGCRTRHWFQIGKMARRKVKRFGASARFFFISLSEIWCPERDSNPHDLRRRCLRPLRLPFRHPGAATQIAAAQPIGKTAGKRPANIQSVLVPNVSQARIEPAL